MKINNLIENCCQWNHNNSNFNKFIQNVHKINNYCFLSGSSTTSSTSVSAEQDLTTNREETSTNKDVTTEATELFTETTITSSIIFEQTTIKIPTTEDDKTTKEINPTTKVTTEEATKLDTTIVNTTPANSEENSSEQTSSDSEIDRITTENIETTQRIDATTVAPICPPGKFGNAPHPEQCDSFYMCAGGIAIQLYCSIGFEFDKHVEVRRVPNNHVSGEGDISLMWAILHDYECKP